jgi:2-oxoglutarate ferredoxin oxidoreductase subunit alpha
MVVYAPASVQEAADLTMQAFSTADRYRNPVLVLGDAIIGQMMEPVTFRDELIEPPPPKPWAVGGKRNGRAFNMINSLSLEEGVVEEWNWEFAKKRELMRKAELKVEEINVSDADLVFVAYGSSARICRSIVQKTRRNGLKTGLIRPITLWPFPYETIAGAAKTASHIVVVEMSLGQLVQDVALAGVGNCTLSLHRRPGGGVPLESDIMEIVEHFLPNKGKGEITRRETILHWRAT